MAENPRNPQGGANLRLEIDDGPGSSDASSQTPQAAEIVRDPEKLRQLAGRRKLDPGARKDVGASVDDEPNGTAAAGPATGPSEPPHRRAVGRE